MSEYTMEIATTARVAEREQNWTSKKDLAAICGVDEKTIQRAVEELTLDTDVHTQKGGYHNSEVFYDDEAVKAIQMQLKKNAISQGKQSEVNFSRMGFFLPFLRYLSPPH